MLKKYKTIRNLSLFLSILSFLFVLTYSAWWLFLFIPALAVTILYSLCLTHLRKDLKNGSRIQVWEGGPRVGKTDTATTIAVCLARKQYKTITRIVKRKWRKYKRIMDLINRNQFCDDDQQSFIYHYHECQKTYSFYQKHPEYIPCLTSNVTILDDRQKSMPYDYDMVVCQKPSLYGMVFNVSEAQSVFPVDSYLERGRSEELSLLANFFERIGHYIDGYFILDSQDADNMNKDIKRLSPAIHKIHHSYGKFFKLFGMRAFSCKETERVAEGEVVVRTDGDDGYRFHLLPCAIGKYNDRHLRKLYPSKDEIVKAVGVEDLIIDDNETNRKLYSRKIIKTSDSNRYRRSR